MAHNTCSFIPSGKLQRVTIAEAYYLLEALTKSSENDFSEKIIFFIVSSDLELQFKSYLNDEENLQARWPYGLKVNVNKTHMTIEKVCKTFCLWTCDLDLVCFERRVLCILKIAVHSPCDYENYNRYFNHGCS